MTTDNPTPNARRGSPGATQPDSPQPIPPIFGERHVAIAPVGDPAAAGQALGAPRQAGNSTPNAPGERPPMVDFRGAGGQAEQAARLGAALRRRP